MHAARQIARYAGLPHCVWDLRTAPPGVGPLGPDVAMPQFPTLALLASGCANPVISVVGAGATSPYSLRNLSDMMHGPGSPAWIDQVTGISVDLSNVSWLVSWDETDVVPTCIADRAEVVRMPALSFECFPLVALGVLDEVLAEYWIAFRDDADAPSLDKLLDDVGRFGLSVSELYRRTAEFVLEWLAQDAD